MSNKPWSIASAKPKLEELFTRAKQFKRGDIKIKYNRLKENAKCDGVKIIEKPVRPEDEDKDEGNYWAEYGWIVEVESGDETKWQEFQGSYFPIHYNLVINTDKEFETRFVTMMHELAHLYCGHVGTWGEKWWPDRRAREDLREIEAESVANLVCKKLKIDNLSREYLSKYVGSSDEPVNKLLDRIDDSLGFIVDAANHIEKMCEEDLVEPRKSESTRWLYVDIILLDGMITFLIPEQKQDKEYGQDAYTRRDLNMQRDIIEGYWSVQAGRSTDEWKSIIDALKMASNNARHSENMVKPTRESWSNIDRIAEVKPRTLLNQARRITYNDIKRFKERRREQLKAPSLHIHTMVRDSKPGLIAWKEPGRRRSVSERLWKVKRNKPSIVREWYEDENKFLYRIFKTKAEADEFLGKLEEEWALYGYVSRKQDVRETLDAIQES